MDDSRNRKSTIALLVAVFWALTSFAYLGSLGRASQPSLLANTYDTLEATHPVKDLGVTEVFKEIYQVSKNRSTGGNASGSAAASYQDKKIATLASVSGASQGPGSCLRHSSKLWLLYRSLLI